MRWFWVVAMGLLSLSMSGSAWAVLIERQAWAEAGVYSLLAFLSALAVAAPANWPGFSDLLKRITAVVLQLRAQSVFLLLDAWIVLCVFVVAVDGWRSLPLLLFVLVAFAGGAATASALTALAPSRTARRYAAGALVVGSALGVLGIWSIRNVVRMALGEF